MNRYSTIECLETRIAPAGILNIVTKTGVVTVTEDPANPGAQTLAITEDMDGFLFDPDDGTALRVDGVLLAAGTSTVVPFVKNLTVKMGKEADTLSFSGALREKLTVDMGGPVDTVSVTNSLLAALVVKGGSDVTLTGTTVAGAVDITPTGPNDLTIGNLTVGGNFNYKSPQGGALELTTGQTVFIGGKASFILGEGAISPNAGPLTVAGALLVSGTGDEDFAFTGTANFYIAGGATFQVSGNIVGFDTTGTVQIGKQLTMKSKTHTFAQRVDADSGVYIGGKVSLSGDVFNQTLRSANSSVLVSGAVSFKASGTATGQTINARDTLGLSSSLTFSTTATGGSTQNVITDPTVGTSTGYINGATKLSGSPIVFFSVRGDVRGPVSINTGKLDTMKSSPNIVIGAAAPTWHGRILAPLTIKAGDIASHFALVTVQNLTITGATSITVGAGQSSVKIYDALLSGALKIDTGAGNDTIKLETDSNQAVVGRYLGAMTFKGGLGEDALQFGGPGANQASVFAGKIKIGFDIETITTDPSAQFLQVFPQL